MMTEDQEEPDLYEGIYAKMQRVEREIDQRFPDRKKRPVLIIMGTTVPSYAKLLAQAIEGVHQSQVIWADAAQRTAFEIKRITEAFESQYCPKTPIMQLDEIRIMAKQLAHTDPDRFVNNPSRRSGRKGAGHAAARDRVICKSAYTQKRK